MVNAKKVKIIYFLTIICIGTSSSLASTFRTGSSIFPTLPVEWDVSPKQFALEQITINNNETSYSVLSSQGFVDIIDFDQQIELPTEEMVISENNNRIKMCQESINGEVSVIQRLEGYEDRLSWKVSIANNIQKDVKLKITLKLPIIAANDFNYWDGYEVHSLTEGVIKRNTLIQTFPVSFLYNNNFGFAVGLAPETLISHLENGIDEQGNLFYSTKVAILPNMETDIEFVFFAVRPYFGHLDAINGYYRRFPTYFKPSPEVDPRITSVGTGASYSSRYTHDPGAVNRVATSIGSFNGTWDWGYAPFKRSGDFYGKEDLWNWEMTEEEESGLASKVARDFDLYDISNFHKQRKDLFENADLRENCNLAFYMINWIEKNYAEENNWLYYVYPYNGTPIINNWVTGFSAEYHIYPWASPFERIVKTDLPLLIDELNINSIAFDNYFNSAVYRGELDYPIKGWSYDLRGKYISTAIGIRYFAEYVKHIEKNGFKIGIIGNTLFDKDSNHQEFTSTFFADAFIVEGKFFDKLGRGDKDALVDIFYNRYFAGHKPLYLWNHFYNFNIGDHVKWENMSPEEIRILYQNVLREIIQCSYQYGFIPTTGTVGGNELIIKEMPIILDVQMRGFEPLPATKGNESLLRQRYGLGLNSAIVISNPTSQIKVSQEKIYNRYLSDYEVLPGDYLGKSLEFSVANNETTFNISVAPIQNEIAVFPLGINFEDKETRLSGVSSGKIGIDKIEYNFVFESNKATAVDLLTASSEGWSVEQIIINGRKEEDDNKASLINGTNIIKVIYKSNVFKVTEDDLLEFNYLDSEIIVSNGLDIRENAAAQMIQGYFENKKKRTIPILEGISADPLKYTITFEKSSDVSQNGIFISDSGKLLIIRGFDSFDIQQKTWKLLRVLDKKYPFLGTLSFTNARTKEMMKKADLLGKPALIIED
mgnify:FL=1